MVKQMQGSFRDDQGQALVEYAMIGALMSLVMVGAVGHFGNQVKSVAYDVARTLATSSDSGNSTQGRSGSMVADNSASCAQPTANPDPLFGTTRPCANGL